MTRAIELLNSINNAEASWELRNAGAEFITNNDMWAEEDFNKGLILWATSITGEDVEEVTKEFNKTFKEDDISFIFIMLDDAAAGLPKELESLNIG